MTEPCGLYENVNHAGCCLKLSTLEPSLFEHRFGRGPLSHPAPGLSLAMGKEPHPLPRIIIVDPVNSPKISVSKYRSGWNAECFSILDQPRWDNPDPYLPVELQEERPDMPLCPGSLDRPFANLPHRPFSPILFLSCQIFHALFFACHSFVSFDSGPLRNLVLLRDVDQTSLEYFGLSLGLCPFHRFLHQRSWGFRDQEDYT